MLEAGDDAVDEVLDSWDQLKYNLKTMNEWDDTLLGTMDGQRVAPFSV